MPKGGPGQTWLSLTKEEADERLRADLQSQDGKANRSLVGKLGAAIKRLIRGI